ncbi:hypothetical protein [Azonexus hydrophilus]|uniref:Transposase n=1 Tax=Azonexus hydrophilus TaxID=418702 RepID=A0ABZ2XL63_9RHOO
MTKNIHYHVEAETPVCATKTLRELLGKLSRPGKKTSLRCHLYLQARFRKSPVIRMVLCPASHGILGCITAELCHADFCHDQESKAALSLLHWEGFLKALGVRDVVVADSVFQAEAERMVIGLPQSTPDRHLTAIAA